MAFVTSRWLEITFYIRERTTLDYKNYQKWMDQDLNLKDLP